MKKKAYIALLLTAVLSAVGCSSQDHIRVSDAGSVSDSAEKSVSDSLEKNDSDSAEKNTVTDDSTDTRTSEKLAITDFSQIFSERDSQVEYEESKSTKIQLSNDSAASSSDAVQISGSTVTITDEGTYILSGNLDDGMVIVNTDKSDKVQIVLDNVAIHSKTSAPIYILQSDKVFITMAAGSENTLENGGTFTAIDENNIDAVIFSKEDLTLNGAGTLTITSPAGHGIVSKDSLKITSGNYNVNCASHAISGKDDVCITSAEFTIVSGKDGIHAENTDDDSLGYVVIQSGNMKVSAEGDGISASSSLLIEDGSFDITAGGGNENAASHHSESWGSFRGGGRHRDDNMRETPSDSPDNSKRMEEAPFGMTEELKMGEMPSGTSEDSKKMGEAPPDMPNNSQETDGNSSDTADTSTDSTSMKGIKASASFVIHGGNFTIDSADDAFHSNASITVNGGTFEIASGDDAFHADETLTVKDGTINITKSYEGLEGEHVNVSGGDITLTASDDGLNAAGGTDSSGNTGGRDGMYGPGSPSASNGSITISGGKLNITASGDGIDANGSLDITGGYIIVSGPTQGDTATLDFDTSGTISGGTFIGTGASGGMAQTFSDSGQGVITANVGNQSAGTQIQLSDSKGNTVFTHTPKLDFSLVIFSSPELTSGEAYTLTVGTSSSEVTAS